MIRNSQVAADLGYLHLPRSFMTENERWQDLKILGPADPNAPQGAADSLESIIDLLPHVVDLLHGRTEH